MENIRAYYFSAVIIDLVACIFFNISRCFCVEETIVKKTQIEILKGRGAYILAHAICTTSKNIDSHRYFYCVHYYQVQYEPFGNSAFTIGTACKNSVEQKI
jgi:hypothetical protein